MGYFLRRFNYSVEMYRGEWVMRARLPMDRAAETDEQIAAVMAHASTNKNKFACGGS